MTPEEKEKFNLKITAKNCPICGLLTNNIEAHITEHKRKRGK